MISVLGQVTKFVGWLVVTCPTDSFAAILNGTLCLFTWGVGAIVEAVRPGPILVNGSLCHSEPHDETDKLFVWQC